MGRTGRAGSLSAGGQGGEALSCVSARQGAGVSQGGARLGSPTSPWSAVRGDVPGPQSLLAMKANPRNVPGGRLQVARDHMDQGGPQIQ